MLCPFCGPDAPEPIVQNALAFAFRDRYPVSPGHTLVVTRRHVPDFFACTPAERAALFDLVEQIKADLDRELEPDAYNVGVNAGVAAGQTVMHVHIHVIPRFLGDVEDPRGGVRWVIPDRGNYLCERDEILPDGDLGGTLYLALAPLLSRARRIDVLAAFVQDSGLALIEPALRAALSRGAHVRLLTGDYLDITQVDALRRLADWSAATAAEQAAAGHAWHVAGSLDARVVETSSLGERAFHPKAWRLEGDDFGVAFVGSSNLSRSALQDGVEWNLRVDRYRDRAAWDRVARSYERLWVAGRILDADFIAAYAARVQANPRPLPVGEVADEARVGLPAPTGLQREALDALAASRRENRRRALIVMATGLGKTVLAALDVVASAAAGRTPSVLWVAHRRELLEQAADTLRRGLPDARFAWLLGGARPAEPYDVLFASVQSLGRAATLAEMDENRFDYVVIDEVHHADAPSYRRIHAHFRPAFLLGLTATPDRADGGDIPALFDDHVPYRADLGTGIGEGLLVPFAYFGLADTADYRGISWRSGRFDVGELSAALETQARMEKLWSVWSEPEKAGARTMVFCASISHASFVRDWLQARGVRVRLCHGGVGSDDRAASLQALEGGHIDAICSVDLFNEGIDCRPLDRVVMLRPTESPVLFLQQLGRGLRTAERKARLVVLDFVGNHRVFLDRVRTLLSLGGDAPGLQAFVVKGETPRLPPGCSLNFELEAIGLLERLLPAGGGTNAAVTLYRELRAAHERRPMAGELVRRGCTLGSWATGRGGWFGFVGDEGDLDPAEAAVFALAADWLREVQVTPMTRCFKMVVLEVLLESDALLTGMELSELATRSHELLARSPELFEDLEGVRELSNPRSPAPLLWAAYWRKNPVNAWCNGPHFRLEGTRFVPRLPAVERPEVLAALTRELVDARLAAYRRRRAVPGSGAVDVKVSWNQREPILFLPTGANRARLPEGDTDVRLPDGTPWRFRFARVAVNVAHPVGRDRNGLPDLLRRWFGPSAGQPGTDFRVRFRPSPDGWWIDPLGELLTFAAERGRFVAFPSLKAAAGWAGRADLDPEAGEVHLPGSAASTEGQFAVRVSGRSMDGGNTPLREGDWAIFEWARGLGLAAFEGRIALVALGADDEGAELHLKRIVRADGEWWLRSDNVDVAPRPAIGAVPYARFVRSIRPEALAPAEGATVADLAATFGLSEVPARAVTRIDGHLFLLAEGRDVLTAPDRWRPLGADPHPGETAYVLARATADAPWTYLGVGRWLEEESVWAFPAPNAGVWRVLSSGRRLSNTLPGDWRRSAVRLAEDAHAKLAGAWLQRGGQRGQIVGRSAEGGLRVRGGEGGFEERTVSLTDLGWALVAAADVRARGGVLDEPRVNRLRYLDGTPKEATRWIDTGWALAVLAALRG